MNAFDFNKITDKFIDKLNRKNEIKTKRVTKRFLKYIFRHIKKQSKKGFYFLDISKNEDFVDYDFIVEKLEALKFHVDRSYGYCYTIEWEKEGEENE